MNSSTYLFFLILIGMLASVLLRTAPFLIFRRRTLPSALEEPVSQLPPAIMAILTVYCLSDMPTADSAQILANLCAIGTIVIIHLWKKNDLLSIASGTAVYMVLLRLL